MPMFAWLGFRGSLREATLVLTAIGAMSHRRAPSGGGPIWALEGRYGLARELVTGFLQVFLLDCGLILLPLSVSVSQQRLRSRRRRPAGTSWPDSSRRRPGPRSWPMA